MDETKSFKVALLLSAGLHALLFSPIAVWMADFDDYKKINDPPKVSYFSVAHKSQIKPPQFQWAESENPHAVGRELPVPQKKQAEANAKETLMSKLQDIIKGKDFIDDKKKAPEVDPEIIEIGEKISSWKETAEDELPEHLQSIYRSYYQNIRGAVGASIRKNYQSYFQEGDITISFALNSDGKLLGARIIGSRGIDERLKKIALKSLREAVPFPKIPKNLEMSQMLFNITIHFRRQ